MTKSTKSRGKSRPTTRSGPSHAGPEDKATEHYHREKARRAVRPTPESDAMAAARREYLALLESDAAKGKGGRPKKKPAAVSPDDADDAPADLGED